MTPEVGLTTALRILAVVLTVSWPQAGLIACAQDILTLRGGWGVASFRIEIADTPDERRQGLMFRQHLGRGSGMLFIYERPGPQSFWMKNTSIPLDLLFLDKTGRVATIHESAVPFSTRPIVGSEMSQYVLEVNAGVVSQFGIDIGSQARHERIDQELAVWPCGHSH